jgi:two-component system, cell cycle sensor histidine kinase and response regulator CckA
VEPLRIVIVEDVPEDAELAARSLRQAGIEVRWHRVETGAQLLDALVGFRPDLILSDYALPAFDGMEALAIALEHAPDLPFIVYTGSLNEETAVECMRAGAWDYVLKDRMSRLPTAVRGALDLARTRREKSAAEAALREKEDVYRAIVTQAADGIVLIDAETLRFAEFNDAACTGLGYTREEFSRLTLVDIQADFSHAEVKDRIEGIVRAGEAVFENRQRSRGGSLRDRQISNRVVHIRGRSYLAAVWHDITARRLAEQEVERERARFRALIESAPFGMRLATSAGAITYLNPAWVALFGYGIQDAPSLDAWRVLAYPDPGERAEVARRWESDRPVRERGEVVTRAVRPTAKDGGRKVVLMTSAALEGGEVLTTCVDMTESAAAQEGQRRLATAIEQAAETIVITGCDGTIEYVNPAFERVTGYTRAEAVGRNPRILKSGRHDAAFYQSLWRTITAGEIWHGRFVNRRKDGNLYQEDATITPIRDERGQVVNYVAIKRDVSRELELLEQLNQAQKMEAVGHLAGGIAHDFNNLLQAMLSQVAVLRHRVTIPDGPVARGFDELDQLVRRGAGLTRQLLLFSRRETSMRERVDLNDVVRGAATLLRRIVRENVAISTELASAPLPVVADRAQLEQVLMNLAVNASDALPSGGGITLQTDGDQRYVRLVVADTGHGMSEAVRAHVFEPFFTTKAAGKGTGLGLSVVHGIVTAHGGRVEVASREGEGTTFTVLLPRDLSAAAEAAEATVPAGEIPRGSGERVLIVEDEDGARDGLAEILSLLGYVVVAVEDGARALDLPATPRFDLLISDLMLPGVSGSDVAAELERRWPALRVILMSGYAEDEAVRRSASVGDVRFLQKPFDVPALAAAVRSALDEREGTR